MGTKPQDDRFTLLRTTDNSPLCISLFPLHPHRFPLFSSFPLPSLSIFIRLLLPYSPLLSANLLSCKSVVSCFCHFFFTLRCLLFFSFHLLTFCFSLCPHNIPKSSSPLCLPSFSVLSTSLYGRSLFSLASSILQQ